MDIEIVPVPVDPPTFIQFRRFPEFRRLQNDLYYITRHWAWGFHKLHMMYPKRFRIGIDFEQLAGGWAVNFVFLVGYFRVATFTGHASMSGVFRPSRVR